MKLSFWTLIKDQRLTLPPLVKVDLTGKTVIVTGTNVGLGLEAAKHFASMNPGKLIVTCRSKEKAEETLAHIRKETGCETVDAWVLDLVEFSSVKAFIKRFSSEGGGRLDVLLESAAVALPNLTFTDDGWETSTQVNNLSTSLIALSLLPLMLETAEKYNTTPRIVVATSETHYWTKLEKRNVDSPNFFRAWAHKDHLTKLAMTRYASTKLLNILFVRALNDRLYQKSIIVNAPNPGLCISALRRNLKFPVTVVTTIMDRLMARTSEEGGRLFVLAAVADEDKKDGLRGEYLSAGVVREPSDFILGEEGRKMQDKLWNDLVEQLGVIEPKILKIVQDCLTDPVRT